MFDNGKAKPEGDREPLLKIRQVMVKFDTFFELLSGTWR